MKHLSRFALLLLSVFGIVYPLYASIVMIEPVPTNVGWFTSITLDASGLPLVSYYGFAGGDLRFLRCKTVECVFTLETPQIIDTGGVGQYTSITLDGNLPVISYYDATNGNLKLAHCNDADCTGATLSVVDNVGNVGGYTSVAMNGATPVISYYDFTNGDLKLARCNDAVCSTATLQTIDAGGNVGQFTSLRINAGLPTISYYDFTNGDLKLARCNDAACTTTSFTTVDAGGNVGQHSSLIIDGTGNPAMSYHDATNGDLKLARCADPQCLNATLTTLPEGTDNNGTYTSIALYPSGNPFISSFNVTQDELRMARCLDANCTNGVVLELWGSMGGYGEYTGAAVSATGMEFVSFYDDINRRPAIYWNETPILVNNNPLYVYRGTTGVINDPLLSAGDQNVNYGSIRTAIGIAITGNFNNAAPTGGTVNGGNFATAATNIVSSAFSIDTEVRFTITSGPSWGTLNFPTTVTFGQVQGGLFNYTHDPANNATTDSFVFTVTDNFVTIGPFTFNIFIIQPNAPLPTAPSAPNNPSVAVFDPAISKIGFLQPGQVGVSGEQIEWVVTVTNTSALTGTNVVVTDTLRPELRIDRVQTNRGTSTINGQTVNVTIPSLASGESVQFSVFTTTLRGVDIDNTACVNADNIVATRCATARPVRTLPTTGESPANARLLLFGGLVGLGLMSALFFRTMRQAKFFTQRP
jgi:uncharacterized repeat protein (TIGR01451 family)